MNDDSPRPPSPSAAPVLSVTALLRSVRDALERRFPLAWVGGEISNLTRAASGHWYFTLKDAGAQVDCAMFRARAALLDWTPREGMKVEARARVTLYEPRGRFQLNVDTLRPAGLGPLYEQFLKLKARLEAEGLFDPQAKRDLPREPRSIGVVTSLAAAALRDVLSALARRDPSLAVIVYPVPVQGADAGGRIAAMLATASARAECDVLLLVRGGGSIEDLWAFNEEAVARAIRAAKIPVVVGVGHETDVTIADFAADQRAATPTAAAELVSTPRAERLAALALLARRATREAQRRIETAAQTVDALSRRLRHPAERLRASRERILQLVLRLASAGARRLDATAFRVREAPPRLAAAWGRRHDAAGARIAQLAASLASLDPQAVLARGYSLTTRASGELLRDAHHAVEGEALRTTLSQGWVESTVTRRG